MPVDVVTGDRDLFQVVDDERQVRVLYIARGVGGTNGSTTPGCSPKYGIPQRTTSTSPRLRGDASDGLPGVAGIGEKTAACLITTTAVSTTILAAASRPDTPISASVRSKLGKAIDYLAVAPTVVAVARDLDLGVTADDLRLPGAPVDPEGFAALTERYGLGGSAERVVASLAGPS